MLPVLDPASTLPAKNTLDIVSLDEDLVVLLQPEANVRQAIQVLISAGAGGEAVRMLSSVLPKKYAIAWACECLRSSQAQGGRMSDTDRAGLALAERWLHAPSDENRRMALEFAENGGFEGAGAWVAAAAGWAGGSLTPAELPEVKMPDGLVGEAVAAALLSLATSGAGGALHLVSFAERALSAFGSAGGTSE